MKQGIYPGATLEIQPWCLACSNTMLAGHWNPGSRSKTELIFYRQQLVMGAQNSKIETSQIPLNQLRDSTPVEQTRFCPPFRRFCRQRVDVQQNVLTATVEIVEPSLEQVTISQDYYEDMEDAFDSKTKNISLESVLLDDHYSDLKMYIGTEDNKRITLQIRAFCQFNTYAFNNIIYEIHMNSIIQSLNCPNLNTFTDKYAIQTGLNIEGEENPLSQVFVLQPIAANLSEIIRYRRENKWQWTVNQFNAFAQDIVNAVYELHKAKVCHNDIRTCNVYYSLEKDCYQLGGFANALPTGDTRARMEVSRVRTSAMYGAPELRTSQLASLEQADVYALGITLLSAFYLCEPLNLSKVTQVNRKYENDYPILRIICAMLKPASQRPSIIDIKYRLPKGEKQARMGSLIQSLHYRNSPKESKLVHAMKDLSDGYQRLGLWNQWKDKQAEAFQLEEHRLDDYKKANSLLELAKIEACRGDIVGKIWSIIESSGYSKQASKLYRNLGYTAYEQGNLDESLNFFTKAIECSKYFEELNHSDMAKNLQGLSLIHAEMGDYELSKPLIKQSALIVIKYAGKQSIDYCKIRMSEAKIESDFGQFDLASQILSECLQISQGIIKKDLQEGTRLKAQLYQQMGRNSMLHSTSAPQDHQLLMGKAHSYITKSIALNENLPNNDTLLATNFETLGELELRKQNYQLAKSNFLKAAELREVKEVEYLGGSLGQQKEKAESLSNIAACEAGLGNYAQALGYYNQVLEIYRHVYGSDHNKMSAMAIGNMSKVYYKLQDKNKAKDCLQLATQILTDLNGPSDPDCEHFRVLQQEQTFIH